MSYVKLGSNVLIILTVTACSSLQPIPKMPTYPAHIGELDGVSVKVDNACRAKAYQVAEQVKHNNVNKEIAAIANGIFVGAVVGLGMVLLAPPPPGPWFNRPDPHFVKPNLAGVGAVTGATAGAATSAVLSQGAVQNMQQVYDIIYNNCINKSLNH